MIDDVKTYTPEVVVDQSFPQQATANTQTSDSSTSNSYKPSEVEEKDFPTPRIAVELIGNVLNTRSKKILAEFEFTKSGAIQIGAYEQGVSGDIRISPNGIEGRNSAGNTTFAIDGDTGDAVFAGELRSGSIVTGIAYIGNNNIILDGENRRIIINDGSNDRILIGRQVGGF